MLRDGPWCGHLQLPVEASQMLPLLMADPNTSESGPHCQKEGSLLPDSSMMLKQCQSVHQKAVLCREEGCLTQELPLRPSMPKRLKGRPVWTFSYSSLPISLVGLLVSIADYLYAITALLL